jgi:poly-beta-1,6-N-acetyl-D-glucosamine synthase
MISVFAVLFWLAVGLLLYHLVGYPLLLVALARVKAQPIQRQEYLPVISVIIAAYNEGGVIKAKLDSVLNSRYPGERLEVIVVEDGSTDNTVEQITSVADPRIILDHSDQRSGKMAAMNRAVQRARGEILVFSDANALLQPDTLYNLMSNFADARVGCASGRKVLAGRPSELETNENLYWRYESWIKTLESRLGSSATATGELLAVRRAIYRLPDSTIINDDSQIVVSTVRQGYRAIVDDTAVTHEPGSDSMSDELGRKSRIAAGRWQLVGQVVKLIGTQPEFVFKFFSHKALRLLVAPLMALALIGNVGAVALNPMGGAGLIPLIGLHTPWGQLALAGQIGLYALAGLGAWLDRRGIRFKPAYFAYYFVSAQLAALAGLVRFSSGRQTVLWRKVAR